MFGDEVKTSKALFSSSAEFFCVGILLIEVLNEVYLQNFLYRWVINRETNLMILINS